jgi:hypothetical protein
MQDFREPSDLNGVGVAITLLVLGLVFAIAVAGFI